MSKYTKGPWSVSTGRAGIGEDSLYFGDSGPYCEQCHGKIAEIVKSELHNLLSTLADIRTALEVMDSLKKYNFKDDHGHPLENCQDFIELVHRAESAESSPPDDASKMGNDHSEDSLNTVEDRVRRLEDLAEYVGSDRILGQLTRIFGIGQPELVELRRLLNALAPEPCGTEGEEE